MLLILRPFSAISTMNVEKYSYHVSHYDSKRPHPVAKVNQGMAMQMRNKKQTEFTIIAYLLGFHYYTFIAILGQKKNECRLHSSCVGGLLLTDLQSFKKLVPFCSLLKLAPDLHPQQFGHPLLLLPHSEVLTHPLLDLLVPVEPRKGDRPDDETVPLVRPRLERSHRDPETHLLKTTGNLLLTFEDN